MKPLFDRPDGNGQLLPCYPLFVKDPFFSVWSPHNRLNDGNTVFWTGMERPYYGLIHANGVAYCFMGQPPACSIKLAQTAVDVRAFTTDYTFACDAFEATISFFSPLPLDDLDVLANPVCYLNYSIHPKRPLKNVSIALFIDEACCYSNTPLPVQGGFHQTPDGALAFMGARKQLVMSQTADGAAAEWGYTYLLGQEAWALSSDSLHAYIDTGKIPFCYSDNARKFLVACNPYGDLSQPVEGSFLHGFDDTLSIFYFGEWLKGYYFRDGKTIFDAFAEARRDYAHITDACRRIEEDLLERAEPYGDDYKLILIASLRQSIAAHKLVQNAKGELLFLSKECRSNGCIATVDVSYPSTPLYLLYNPELVKGMLRPILTFSRMPVWQYDFAPHDVGTYPYCNGQVYGVIDREAPFGVADSTPDHLATWPHFYAYPATRNIYRHEMQMPVEECGNMLIMVAAALRADGDLSLAETHFDLLKGWVCYLERYGLVPGDQLCTDDFAGHLAKNINLSVKAIVGMRAYADICRRLGKEKEAAAMHEKALDYAAQWRKLVKRVPTPLVFDGDKDSFSLKYNMAFDVLFGAELFPADLREAEVDSYLEKIDTFGTPLDNRKRYTKSDWLVWAASLTDDVEKRKKLLAPIARFLRETPDRVPFSDWYETETGVHCFFQNRTVQGGTFMLLLADSGRLRD